MPGTNPKDQPSSTARVATDQANGSLSPLACTLLVTLPPTGNPLSSGLGRHPPPTPAPAALEEPGSPQKLCTLNGDNNSASPNTLTLAQRPIPRDCDTKSRLASRELNCHVGPSNNVYRWAIKNTPIPVGIDLSGFEGYKKGMGSLVRGCLITVLKKFNDNGVGPKFEFARNPSSSAFVVTFGGRHDGYASSFFPDSDPNDWYIYVYSPGLTLCKEQSDSLLNDTVGDIPTARSRALERKLVNILTHEMLHVVGVRHCDAHLTETSEPCVRFPSDLSDEENNEERLMQRRIHWQDLSRIDFDWNPRTLEEIRQIYQPERTHIGDRRVRDVLWQEGVRERKEIARNNAGFCTPNSQDNSRRGLLRAIVLSCWG